MEKYIYHSTDLQQNNNWNEMTIENVINNNRQQITASFKMVNMVA